MKKTTSHKELMGASTAILVLTVLAREADYGYRIVKRINDEAEGLFTWQEGTIYPVLHKLEKEKYLRTQWQEADTGRRRKYYYITEQGREGLTEKRREWASVNNLITRLTEA